MQLYDDTTDESTIEFLKPEQVKKEFDFYMQVKQLLRFPAALCRFINQFHSKILSDFMEGLADVVTYYEFEQFLKAALFEGSEFTVKKQLNLCYSLCQIAKYQNYAMYFDSDVNSLLKRLYGRAKIEVSEDQVIQKRLEYLVNVW